MSKQTSHSSPSPSSSSPRSSPAKLPAALRSRSLSPRKKIACQPLHIRMNLTEGQMDKITDVFTYKGSTSPTKERAKIFDVNPKEEDEEQIMGNELASPTFSELMPAKQDQSSSPSLAHRRHQSPPSALQISKTDKGTPKLQRSRMETVDETGSPLSPSRIRSQRRHPARTSSKYSIQDAPVEAPLPLQIDHNKFNYPSPKLNGPAFDTSNHWAQICNAGISPEVSPLQYTTHHQQQRAMNNATASRRHQSHVAEIQDVSPLTASSYAQSKVLESPMFSPLAFYFRDQDVPVKRRGHKTLIGDNGWLEKTGYQTPKPTRTPSRKTNIFDSIRKIARDMTELPYTQRRESSTSKAPHVTAAVISLDAREQSLLCCELEYHLTGALNSYIARELEKGHLIPDNFKKITDSWIQQGRPRVVGFRFDLETQIDLISLHVNDFNFSGRRQGQPSEIAGLLHAMKMNARAMRIRTFCQPDSVIAKHLMDSQAFLDMVDAPDVSQIALAEIVQFFKVIVEREQNQPMHIKRS